MTGIVKLLSRALLAPILFPVVKCQLYFFLYLKLRQFSCSMRMDRATFVLDYNVFDTSIKCTLLTMSRYDDRT